MKYYTDPYHPNFRDAPQGTTVYWSAHDPEDVEVLIWNNYSSGENEYDAVLSRFSVDEAKKVLTLENVSIKRKYSTWDDSLTNPASYVSDRAKRAVRSFIAVDKNSQHWRVRLFKD